MRHLVTYSFLQSCMFAFSQALSQSQTRSTTLLFDLSIYHTSLTRYNLKSAARNKKSYGLYFRYPLLLSRICKATPRRNQDREKLKMAQRRIEEQLNKINAVSEQTEACDMIYSSSHQLDSRTKSEDHF